MYYYISFLRPPPNQVSPASKNISITPQVANDLRTELFHDEVDLFLSWVPCTAGLSSMQQATRLSKLTTWKPATAYKEIPVSMPPGVREGQTWKIVLSAESSAPVDPRIPLFSPSCGSVPFPVISMPILFSSRGFNTRAGSKQERIQRVLSLGPRSYDETHSPSVIITEQTSFDLDKKLWDSGIGLSSWILDQFSESPQESGHPLVQRMGELLRRRQDIKVVELGAGTGIASIALSSLRGMLPLDSADESEIDVKPQDIILTTDLESAMPLLNENIEKNNRLSGRGIPRAHVLDWEEQDIPEPIRAAQEQGLDLILMADVTYNTSVFPALVRTVKSLVRGSKREPLILLGFKERDPDERTLWDMASDIDISLVKVDERPGSGGEPVEVWIGESRSREGQP